MALNSAGMGYTFNAKDLASGTMMRLRGSLNQLRKTSDVVAKAYNRNMSQIKSGGAMMAGGALGLGAIGKAAIHYGKFEYQLKSAGIVMGATSRQMKELEEAAIQAGIKTQFSPKEAAQGLQNLGAAGMNAKQSLSTLNPVLALAAGSMGQLGVAEAASVTIGVLNAFGETTDKAALRVNQLTVAHQKSGFQARDFSIAISQAAAQAKSADQSFESMVATLGLLRNTNLDASSSATAYREATRRLSGDQRAQKLLAKQGVKAMDASGTKIRDLAEIVAELHPKLQKLNAEERNFNLGKIFGVRGMKAYNAIVMGYNKLLKEGKVRAGDFAGAHRILVEQMEAQKGLSLEKGAAGQTSKKMLDTLEGQRILLKGSIDTLKTVFGKLFVPIVLPAFKAMTKWANKLIKVIEAIPGPAKAFLTQFAGIGLAMMSVVGTLKMLRGALGILTLGRMAGKVVAGQAAIATSTKASTVAMNAQAAAAMRAGKMGTFFGKIGRGVGAALPIIGIGVAMWQGLNAWEEAKEKKRKKREAEHQRQMWATHDIYEKTAGMVKRLKQEQSKTAAESIKAASKNLGKAMELMRKYQGQYGVSEKEVFKHLGNMGKAFQQHGPGSKQFAKAHQAYSKGLAKMRVASKALLEVEAIVAQKRLRYTKHPGLRQHYGETIIAARVEKYNQQMRVLETENKRQQTFLAGLEKKDPKSAKAKRHEWDKVYRAQHDSLDAWRMKTTGMSKKMGFGGRVADITNIHASRMKGMQPMLQRMAGELGQFGRRSALNMKTFRGPSQAAEGRRDHMAFYAALSGKENQAVRNMNARQRYAFVRIMNAYQAKTEMPDDAKEKKRLESTRQFLQDLGTKAAAAIERRDVVVKMYMDGEQIGEATTKAAANDKSRKDGTTKGKGGG